MRELGAPNVDYDDATKTKILMVAVEKFALFGYDKVSMRDLAEASSIVAPSIYNHFSNKQDILGAIMHRYESELNQFYEMQARLSAEANSLREILDVVMAEVKKRVHPFSYYAALCAMRNQFAFEPARHVFYDVFLIRGRDVTRRQLELAVERGLARPFDCEAAAVTLSNCVLSVLSFQVGQIHGFYENMDIEKWCEGQIRLVLSVAGMEA